MNLIGSLNTKLDVLHLLKHPYYQKWNMGELTIPALQVYAQEYYHHVAAFPRYISAIHSRCSDIKNRQVLLANLIEEESGEENHPELWLMDTLNLRKKIMLRVSEHFMHTNAKPLLYLNPKLRG